MKNFKSVLGKAALMVLMFTVVCGIIYPLLITGISQVAFKDKANGSIIEIDGVKYGSELLAQQFSDEKHMWGRVMALDTASYFNEEGNTKMYAWASNKSPAYDAENDINPDNDEEEDYADMIQARVDMIKEVNPDAKTEAIPVDLVTISGSGLDPSISLAAAKYQVPRIAKENQMSEKEVQKIIDKYTTGKFLGIIGEKTVNVLKVNLALEGVL